MRVVSGWFVNQALTSRQETSKILSFCLSTLESLGTHGISHAWSLEFPFMINVKVILSQFRKTVDSFPLEDSFGEEASDAGPNISNNSKKSFPGMLNSDSASAKSSRSSIFSLDNYIPIRLFSKDSLSSDPRDTITFQIEIVKIGQSDGLHGLNFKRIDGSVRAYRIVSTRIMPRFKGLKKSGTVSESSSFSNFKHNSHNLGNSEFVLNSGQLTSHK